MVKAVKYSVLFIIFYLKLSSQSIAPIVFTVTGSAPSNSHFNACVEDTINNKLYLQSSCVCGIGPTNIYSGFCSADVLTKIIGPSYVSYNPYGVERITSQIHYSDNAIYVNDAVNFARYNTPAFSNVWTYTASSSQTVVASTMRNDSVFTITDDGSFCQVLEIRNRNTGALISFNSIDCNLALKGYISGDVKVMKLFGNKLYLAGGFTANNSSSIPIEDNITSIDLTNGNIVPLNFSVNDSIKDMEFYNGKIHISGNFTSVKGQTRNRYASLDLAGNLQNGTPSFNNNVENIEVYGNYLFVYGRFTSINAVPVSPFTVKAINLNLNAIMNWNFSVTYPPSAGTDFMMEKSRNRLFMANKKIGGMFLDGFCLPPIKTSTLISAASTTLCEQTNNLTFSVSPFTYASSYIWTYTGVGASITNLGNSVSVNFASGATSGKLKVVANSVCGGVSDTLSIYITVYPRPNATAGLVDDTLNCFRPKVPILGNSSTPGVTFSWSGPSGYSSLQQNDSTGYYLPGNYNLTATAPITGCTRTLSLLVRIDTLKPDLVLPSGPYLVGCGTSSLITLNGTSTTTPTSLWWTNSSATIIPNPATVSLGSYSLVVKNTYNGCMQTSSLISVTSSGALPIVTLTSHTYSNLSTPVDTITCLKTSVTLSVSCTPTNCTIVWKDMATFTTTSNPVTVYGGGNQMPIVTRLDNNCVDSSKIVLVNQDIVKPNSVILTPNPNINCSNSTATLTRHIRQLPLQQRGVAHRVFLHQILR